MTDFETLILVKNVVVSAFMISVSFALMFAFFGKK